ncbi:6048_t:CDS:1, partial [Paraglomus occultum]
DLPMTPPESPVRQSIVAAEQNDAMDVISEPDMLPSSAFGREGGMSDKISCNEQSSWWEQGEKPVFGSGSTLSGSYSTKPKKHARSSSSGYFWTKKENDGERKSVL